MPWVKNVPVHARVSRVELGMDGIKASTSSRWEAIGLDTLGVRERMPYCR